MTEFRKMQKMRKRFYQWVRHMFIKINDATDELVTDLALLKKRLTKLASLAGIMTGNKISVLLVRNPMAVPLRQDNNGTLPDLNRSF